jgi:hypothetical protein
MPEMETRVAIMMKKAEEEGGGSAGRRGRVHGLGGRHQRP